MADLSTLDPTQPPDTQAVSQGAARIRETRGATITSFGIEHALTGEHKIPVGSTAARPAAGHAGRLYINTDLGLLQYDSGSSWATLVTSTIGPQATTNAGPVTIANGSFTSLGTAFTPISSTFTNWIAIGHFAVTFGATTLGVRFSVNGSPNPTRTYTGLTSSVGSTITLVEFVSPGTGSQSVDFQAEGVGGTHTATRIINVLFPYS